MQSGKEGGNQPAAGAKTAPSSGAGSFSQQADSKLNRGGEKTAEDGAALIRCRVNLTGGAFAALCPDDASIEGSVALLDFGSGKDGVLSRRDADALELRVMSKIEMGEGANLATTEDEGMRLSFLMAFRLYLAMHSSENADDGSGAIEDGVTFSFGGSTLSGSDVKAAAQMSSFHRYLRCRADEVRDAIKFTLRRAGAVDAPRVFPLACESARAIRVHAANRHMPDYPQYAFVGAEYCSTVTPRVRDVINASKTALLAARQGPEARSAHKFPKNAVHENAAVVIPDF